MINSMPDNTKALIYYTRSLATDISIFEKIYEFLINRYESEIPSYIYQKYKGCWFVLDKSLSRYENLTQTEKADLAQQGITTFEDYAISDHNLAHIVLRRKSLVYETNADGTFVLNENNEKIVKEYIEPYFNDEYPFPACEYYSYDAPLKDPNYHINTNSVINSSQLIMNKIGPYDGTYNDKDMHDNLYVEKETFKEEFYIYNDYNIKKFGITDNPDTTKHPCVKIDREKSDITLIFPRNINTDNILISINQLFPPWEYKTYYVEGRKYYDKQVIYIKNNAIHINKVNIMSDVYKVYYDDTSFKYQLECLRSTKTTKIEDGNIVEVDKFSQEDIDFFNYCYYSYYIGDTIHHRIKSTLTRSELTRLINMVTNKELPHIFVNVKIHRWKDVKIEKIPFYKGTAGWFNSDEIIGNNYLVFLNGVRHSYLRNNVNGHLFYITGINTDYAKRIDPDNIQLYKITNMNNKLTDFSTEEFNKFLSLITNIDDYNNIKNWFIQTDVVNDKWGLSVEYLTKNNEVKKIAIKYKYLYNVKIEESHASKNIIPNWVELNIPFYNSLVLYNGCDHDYEITKEENMLYFPTSYFGVNEVSGDANIVGINIMRDKIRG